MRRRCWVLAATAAVLAVVSDGAANEVEKAIAYARLRGVCNDRGRYPWLICQRGPTDEYMMRAGTFGAGVIAEIDNDPQKYGVDIYADCKVTSKLNEPLSVDLRPERRLKPEDFPKIPVFLKTAQKGQIGRAVKHERVPFKDPFDFEKKRARALVNSNMAPAIFDVVDQRTKELLLSDDYYMMQYYDSISMYAIWRVLRKDLADIWTAQVKAISRALSMQDANLANEMIARFRTEGWIRVRSFVTVVDAVLGLVRRLWSRDFRHCDLHGENILAVKETVSVNSGYFHAIISHGRGVPLEGAMAGIPWANLQETKSDLLSRGVDRVTFVVLHPSRFRLIDLAYMIYMGRNKEKYRLEHGGASQPHPCRLLSSNRAEDTYELHRWLSRIIKSHVTTAWSIASSSARLASVASGSLGKGAVETLTKIVDELEGFLQALYNGVIRNNAPWSDCVQAQEMYKSHYASTPSAERAAVRNKFHTEISLVCTEAREMQALRNAQVSLEALGRRLQERLPPHMRAGIVGTASWPQLPSLDGDVAGHISGGKPRAAEDAESSGVSSEERRAS